jgi:hypothetical protein
MIALIWMVIPGSIVAIKLAQVALHAATAWLVYKTARRISPDRIVPVLAGVLFAANPFFFYMAAAIQTETLQVFLFTTVVFLLVSMLVDQLVDFRRSASSGLMLGLAALCKPSALGIGLGLAAFLCYAKFGQKNGLTASFVMIAAMFLSILPWTIYNWKTRGELILINDSAGFNLWAGNLPEPVEISEGTFSDQVEAYAFADNLGKENIRRQISEWEQTIGYSALSISQRQQLWTDSAIRNMTADPLLTAKLFGWKFLNYWKPFVSAKIYSSKASVASALVLIPFYVVGIFGLIGIWKSKSNRGIAQLFIAISILSTAIHVAVVSSMRLRLPYIDPFLTVFASFGLVDLVGRFGASRVKAAIA